MQYAISTCNMSFVGLNLPRVDLLEGKGKRKKKKIWIVEARTHDNFVGP